MKVDRGENKEMIVFQNRINGEVKKLEVMKSEVEKGKNYESIKFI